MFTRPRSKVRIMGFLLSFGFALVGLTGSSYAQVAVGTCRPNLVHFDNLDDAVHGVPAGETILVCPGTYAEQVSINTSLTLRGVQDGNSGLPIIVPPAGGLIRNATGFNLPFSFYRNAALAAQILVSNGATVNIFDIALDATNSVLTDCSLDPVGVLYQDSSGTVNRVAVKNEISPCLSNGQPNPQGDGVLVQSDGVFPADVTVENSSFDNIGLNGLDANGPVAGGVTFTAKGNTLVGPGITAGNGVYLSFADGTIHNNAISNAISNASFVTGTSFYFGIISECSSTFTASNNKISNTQVGIDVVSATAFCTTTPAGYSITSNEVFHTQLNGIEACGANHIIQSNTINDSGQGGVVLDDTIFNSACGTQAVTVSSNAINRACAAVLQGPANVGNVIGPNAIFNSKFLLLTGTSCQ